MNKNISNFVKEFKDIYDGKPWLDVTLIMVLSKVSREKAFRKPVKKLHSIAEILCHIVEYRKFLIAQFEWNEKFDVNQKASFYTKKYDDNWQSILRALKSTQKSIVDSLNNAGDETLKRRVFHRKYNIGYLLNGIIQHDIYHLGQLMLLSKFSVN